MQRHAAHNQNETWSAVLCGCIGDDAVSKRPIGELRRDSSLGLRRRPADEVQKLRMRLGSLHPTSQQSERGFCLLCALI